MLQLVNESALAPAAVLQHHTLVHFLTAPFLNVEFLPCDVIISIIREGLERACSTTPPTAVPGVTNPVAALELLNSSQRELSHELVALSSSCTCSGVQCPTILDTASKKLLPSEASSMKAFMEEIQRISTQTLDGQPPVYVGALARAFPTFMSFENALTCIVDLAQSTKSSDAGTPSWGTPCGVTPSVTPTASGGGVTPTDALSPAALRSPVGALSSAGGISPCGVMSPDGGLSPGGGRSPAHDEVDDRACAFLTAASRRSSVPSQEGELSGSGALGSSARGLSTMGTSFWSPRTTMTEGDAILATAETPSASMLRCGPERTKEAAHLLAEHGGWMAESSRSDSVRSERQLFLDFEGYRPAGAHPSHLLPVATRSTCMYVRVLAVVSVCASTACVLQSNPNDNLINSRSATGEQRDLT